MALAEAALAGLVRSETRQTIELSKVGTSATRLESTASRSERQKSNGDVGRRMVGDDEDVAEDARRSALDVEQRDRVERRGLDDRGGFEHRFDVLELQVDRQMIRSARTRNGR